MIFSLEDLLGTRVILVGNLSRVMRNLGVNAYYSWVTLAVMRITRVTLGVMRNSRITLGVMLLRHPQHPH
jgi:hypothetical protein